MNLVQDGIGQKMGLFITGTAMFVTALLVGFIRSWKLTLIMLSGTVCMVLIMGFSFVEAFILPHVTNTSPAFVQAWMGMFNGPAGTFNLGVLPTVWTLTAPIYILGGVLFGIATFRAGVLPRWAGLLLALSTLLAPVAAFLPNAAQPKMAIPMGIALAWLGFALWTEQRTQPLSQASREHATAV